MWFRVFGAKEGGPTGGILLVGLAGTEVVSSIIGSGGVVDVVVYMVVMSGVGLD